MATKTETPGAMQGTAAQKKLAEATQTLLMRRATMTGHGSLISAPLAMIAQSLSVDIAVVEAALAANPTTFQREERDGQIYFGVEKPGLRADRVSDWKPQHDFVNRLNPDATSVSAEESRQIAADFARRAAATKAARIQAEQEQLLQEQEAMRAMQNAAAQMTEEDTFSRYTLPDITYTEDYVTASELPVESFTAIPLEPVVLNTVYRLTVDGIEQQVDLSTAEDELLAQYSSTFREMLRGALAEDFRFVNFAEQWYLDDLVERFSKGDLRKIKDYLTETNEPLSDRAFLTDLFNKKPSDPDYETMRFSLNYRLLKEKKEFEFVGAADERMWLPANSTLVHQKRKASEIGQDYRYLDELSLAESEDVIRGEGKRKLEHTLSYYEYENGLMPFDRTAQAFFPGAVLDDQRAAMFRFESPQLYVTYLVELRFPSANRGGYLVGLDEFYQNLVPGASFSIEETGRPSVYTITYSRLSQQQEERLLQFDERRSRFVFRPVVFNVQTNPQWLLTESRYPRLDTLQRLEETERKRPELVISRSFEVVGEQVERDGTNVYSASLADLLPVVNIQRPYSRAYLRAILLSTQYPYFKESASGDDTFEYDPSKR